MSIPVGDADVSASSTTDAAIDQASNLASKIHEQGGAAVDSIQAGGQQIVGEAKVQVGRLNDEAQKQIHAVVEQAQAELGVRATEQTEKAATSLRGLADEFHALAEGRTEGASRLIPYVRRAGDGASEYAARLETGGFAGISEDLTYFARRRPGLFLLGALAAGFATARFVRGAQKAGATADVAVAPPSSPALLTSDGSYAGAFAGPEEAEVG